MRARPPEAIAQALECLGYKCKFENNDIILSTPARDERGRFLDLKPYLETLNISRVQIIDFKLFFESVKVKDLKAFKRSLASLKTPTKGKEMEERCSAFKKALENAGYGVTEKGNNLELKLPDMIDLVKIPDRHTPKYEQERNRGKGMSM